MRQDVGYMCNSKEAKVLSLKTDYLVFMDECGDPSLHKDLKIYNNPSVPPIMTVLAVVVPVASYRDVMLPRIDDMKEDFFGRKDIYFHSNEIRRKDGIFKIFLNLNIYDSFKVRMNDVLQQSGIQIISCSIDKRKLYDSVNGKRRNVGNLYLRNTEYVLERVGHLLGDKRGQIIFETVGKKESTKIQGVLSQIRRGGNNYNSPRTFRGIKKDVLFFTKQENVNGLQVADYLAYPFFRHAKNRDDFDNKLFDLLRPYVYKGDYDEYGLKEWPL